MCLHQLIPKEDYPEIAKEGDCCVGYQVLRVEDDFVSTVYRGQPKKNQPKQKWLNERDWREPRDPNVTDRKSTNKVKSYSDEYYEVGWHIMTDYKEAEQYFMEQIVFYNSRYFLHKVYFMESDICAYGVQKIGTKTKFGVRCVVTKRKFIVGEI